MKPGQHIRPPSETGVPSCSRYGAAGVHDPRKVYVTTSPSAALMFASMHPSGNGQVYKVETIGAVEPDPDCTGLDLSFTCGGAVILARIRTKRKLMQRVRRVAMSA